MYCQHHNCKKSLFTFDFHCKCGKHFCLKHKDPCDHNCDFDYKAQHKKDIIKQNPVVVCEKVTKI